MNQLEQQLVKALHEILAFDSFDYGLHIKGMQQIARAALVKANAQDANLMDVQS